MEGTEPRFHEGDRVRLRDGIDPLLYQGMSTIGNEGVITGVKKDKYDLPLVWVEWDKNHWTYNGAPDCWTFEDHFDLIESSMSDQSKQDKIQEIATAIAAILGDDEKKPEPKPAKPTKSDKAAHIRALLAGTPTPEPEPEAAQDDNTEAIAAIAEQLAQSEAFIIVAVSREDDPRAKDGALVPLALSYARDDVAGLVASAHLAGLAAKYHQGICLQAIASLQDES